MDPELLRAIADLKSARDAARDAWGEFDRLRSDAVKSAHGEASEESLAKSEEAQKAYQVKADAVKAAEEALGVIAAKVSTGPSQVPGFGFDPTGPGGDSDTVAGMKEWGKGVVAKLAERKALDGTSGGTLVPPFFDNVLRRLPARQLFVRSIIPVRPASGDKIWYLRQTVRTNNAAPVAAGGTKPTSTFTVERIEATFRTIAHVTEALDRALLADHEALGDFLSSELRLGVLLAEEDQILNGNGTAPNLRGILNVSGILTQALGSDSRSDAIMKAITAVRVSGTLEPDAIVMHPSDYQDVALEKTADGEYVHGKPTDAEPGRIWGKPVITSTAIASGTALVGAFADASAIYLREDARVDFTDSHDDEFIKNQVRFRGEERLQVAVFRPAGFCTVTGI